MKDVLLRYFTLALILLAVLVGCSGKTGCAESVLLEIEQCSKDFDEISKMMIARAEDGVSISQVQNEYASNIEFYIDGRIAAETKWNECKASADESELKRYDSAQKRMNEAALRLAEAFAGRNGRD